MYSPFLHQRSEALSDELCEESKSEECYLASVY